MVVFFGIALLLVAGFLFSVIYLEQKEYSSATPIATCGGLCAVFAIAGLGIIMEHYHPSITPMDVYRGRTTLEITYKDSVAIDSVVVWKEEIK